MIVAFTFLLLLVTFFLIAVVIFLNKMYVTMRDYCNKVDKYCSKVDFTLKEQDEINTVYKTNYLEIIKLLQNINKPDDPTHY